MRVSKLETLHANVSITELRRMRSISLQEEMPFNTDSFESHAEKLRLPLLHLRLCWTEMELQGIVHWTHGREEISDISNFNWSN